jgi:DNA-binding transcriptional MerR regulator
MSEASATMRVAALARQVGVKPDTVRYYECVGLLPPPPGTAATHRRYDDTAVDRLRFIQGAQRLGLPACRYSPIAGPSGHGACPSEPAATLLRRRLAQIDEEINRLAALRDGLQRFIARLPAVDGPEPVPGRW